MRTEIVVAVMVGSAVSAVAAEVPGASRIQSVLVFPSGAEVTRVAKVKIPKGEHTIVFPDLPAQAVHSSVRVEGKAAARLDIGAVDTRHASVPRADAVNAETERRRIETDIEKLRNQRAIFEGQKQAAETQKALIQNLTQLPVRPAPASGPAAAGENWPQILSLIATSSAEAQRAIIEADVNLRDTDRRIADLEGKLGELPPSLEERTEVKVTVAAGDAVEADLVVRYQVPGASWTPLYDARLLTGSKTQAPKLELVRRAAIKQHTGEAWREAAIELSTTRPNSSAAAPNLNPLIVDYEPEQKPRSLAPPAPMSSLGGARDMAEAAGALEGDGDLPRARVAAKMVAAQPIRADVVNAPFQAIFQVPGKHTVEPTGEAKRVELAADAVEPQLMVRAVPRRDQKAYLYAKLSVPKGAPLIAGQVSLFRDGTFVGTSSLPLLSPGEDHELGFGADDRVRVKFAIAEEKKGETGIISSSKTEVRNFKITLKNGHERAMAFVVLDQTPVSQQQDIKVEPTSRPAPSRQNVDDKRGIVAWDGELKADEERTIEHGWRLVWPAAKSIVQR